MRCNGTKSKFECGDNKNNENYGWIGKQNNSGMRSDHERDAFQLLSQFADEDCPSVLGCWRHISAQHSFRRGE